MVVVQEKLQPWKAKHKSTNRSGISSPRKYCSRRARPTGIVRGNNSKRAGIAKIYKELKQNSHGPDYDPRFSTQQHYYDLQNAREIHATMRPHLYAIADKTPIFWGTIANGGVVVKGSSLEGAGKGIFAGRDYPECPLDPLKINNMSQIIGQPWVVCAYDGDYFLESSKAATTHVASFNGKFTSGMNGLELSEKLVLDDSNGTYATESPVMNHLGFGCIANSLVCPANCAAITVKCLVADQHHGKAKQGNLVIERVFLVAIIDIAEGDELFWDYPMVMH